MFSYGGEDDQELYEGGGNDEERLEGGSSYG